MMHFERLGEKEPMMTQSFELRRVGIVENRVVRSGILRFSEHGIEFPF